MPAPQEASREQQIYEALFNEKIKRLDDKIEQSERYLAERCDKIIEKVGATEKLLTVTQENAKEAVKIANDASKLRFDSFNEFNARIAQMATTFFTIPAFEQFRNSYDSWRGDINKRMDRREGESSGIKLTGSTIMGGMAFLVALATLAVIIAAWLSKH